MERGGIELCQDIDAAEPGIDAIGNGNVHQPVFTRQRHGGLGALFGQGVQACSLAAAHDDGQHVADVDRLAPAVQHKPVRPPIYCEPPSQSNNGFVI